MIQKPVAYILSILFLLSMVARFAPEAEAALQTVPATLTNISCKYNDNVRFLDLTGITIVGGNLKLPIAVSAGDVLVDRTHKTSMKILKVNPDGTVLLSKPSMIELFKEFEIPEQTIIPTAANITEFEVKGISMQDYLAKLAQNQQSIPGGEQKPVCRLRTSAA